MECYLDNSATTRAFPEVAEIVSMVMTEDYGNPSSLHRIGTNAERRVREAKEKIAATLKCKPANILFTSGGTESDNLAIIGAAEGLKRRGNHLITTVVEHPAVLQTMKHMEELGYRVTYLGVDRSGRISLEELDAALTPDTILVSMMHTNNEIGSVMPIAEAAKLTHRKCPEAVFHVDAVQGYGKAVINPSKMGIDLMSASGHKVHGPKGIGFLYIGDKIRLLPICYGGGQQGNLRSGTENVPGIAGLALACSKLYANLNEDLDFLYGLKKRMIDRLRERVPEVVINGLPEDDNLWTQEGVNPDLLRQTAPHIVSISVPGVRSEVLLHSLEDKEIYISAGSACSSHKRTPSATLVGIGVDSKLLETTVRISFCVETTEEMVDYTLEQMVERIGFLKRYTAR